MCSLCMQVHPYRYSFLSLKLSTSYKKELFIDALGNIHDPTSKLSQLQVPNTTRICIIGPLWVLTKLHCRCVQILHSRKHISSNHSVVASLVMDGIRANTNIKRERAMCVVLERRPDGRTRDTSATANPEGRSNALLTVRCPGVPGQYWHRANTQRRALFSLLGHVFTVNP